MGPWARARKQKLEVIKIWDMAEWLESQELKTYTAKVLSLYFNQEG